MIFFTADHHFGHENILKYAKRPWKNIEDMNENLMTRWNDTVQEGDTVFYVGDFTLKDRGYAESIIKRLNGVIFFMPGSHDSWWSDKIYSLKTKTDSAFSAPALYEFKGLIKNDAGFGLPIVLCHYAMRSWAVSHYGSWHLFGHHHGNLEPYGLSFDIGVDCWDYYPVSLDQVKNKMATLKPIVDYSKGVNDK